MTYNQETAKAITGQISRADMWDGNSLDGKQMIGEVVEDLTSVTLAMDLAKKAGHFTLPHFDEFYRTYPSVTEGTPMYIAPGDRILVW